MKLTKKIKFPRDINWWKVQLEALNPLALIVPGVLLLLLLSLLLFSGGTSQDDNDAFYKNAEKTMRQVSETVHSFRKVLMDSQLRQLVASAAAAPDQLAGLRQYVGERVPELIDIQLYDNNLAELRPLDMGPFGFALYDMLLSAQELGQSTVQVHGAGADAYMAMVVRAGGEASPVVYLLVKVRPSLIVTAFKASLPAAGVFALYQHNGLFMPTRVSEFAVRPTSSERVSWLLIPGSFLRVGVTQAIWVSSSNVFLHLLLFVVGLIALGFGVLLKFRPYKIPPEEPEKPEKPLQAVQNQSGQMQAGVVPEVSGQAEGAGEDQPDEQETRNLIEHLDSLGEVGLPNLSFNREKGDMAPSKNLPPVELVETIFRAYDIRGIIGETLDAEIARQVGQVVGSLTLEQEAGPVVVARDGRVSGPDLAAGMVEGIASTGCDVVDIGAVPTGVLYFAAYELGNGTGVMVTGSHNPPNYNGFKALIGGVTQSGQQITDMYTRIKSGNLRVGKGEVKQEKMVGRYREKISGDIQLQKPLKVVADCGNGIGAVCAADVLRDIGAEVFPLFDDVDGSFPNHHPDPSEPENLQDLIISVKIMGADLGVAFDGDADRLGVVTPAGDIIYADRLMMLFVRDILARCPGETVIYDVKCTGHLHEEIEAAGGKAMMYKTGHSLIKNKMKEVDAPFAGEMSGHFFFKERWYGFDCGIYAAARLLEILAADERGAEEILNSLPDSYSTPELKVETAEGENHTFVTRMQQEAVFADATINTIDGVRADYADGWGLVRASNTTPVLVLRFDADSEIALERIKDEFKQQMLAINDQLDLPF